jgi:hypothetical protein
VASVTFHPPVQQFPAGTAVKVFALPTPRPAELLRSYTGNPETWAGPRLGAPAASGTVAADGSLPVNIGTGANELPGGKPGLAAAEVGGEWRYLHIRNTEATREPV